MEIFEFIDSQCEQLSIPSRAQEMKAYMKFQFDYFGINAPTRKELLKSIKQLYTFKLNDELWQLVELLWKSEQRELQYLALDILRPLSSKMTHEHLPVLEKMITTKSWWDTVDCIAPNMVGAIFQKNIVWRDKYIYHWVESSNIWLQRSAIIFQLKYRQKTDIDLLFEVILKLENSHEFFIRKAQGWALREYSKRNPVLVKQFVEANSQLSGLTKREALRLF